MVTLEQHVASSGKLSGRNMEELLQWLEDQGFNLQEPYDPKTMASFLPKELRDTWKAKYAAVFTRPRTNRPRFLRTGMSSDPFMGTLENVVGNLEEWLEKSFLFRAFFYVMLYTSVFDVIRIVIVSATDLWPWEFVSNFDDPLIAMFTLFLALPFYIFFYFYRLLCQLIVSYTLYQLVRHPDNNLF